MRALVTKTSDEKYREPIDLHTLADLLAFVGSFSDDVIISTDGVHRERGDAERFGPVDIYFEIYDDWRE